jgi:hypothetical protein
MVADDQTRRAEMVAQAVPAVVSPCETPQERAGAVERLSALSAGTRSGLRTFDLGGAECASDEILALMSAG